MPTYEYECGKCRRVFEIRQRISEPPLTTCDVCGGEVHRLIITPTGRVVRLRPSAAGGRADTKTDGKSTTTDGKSSGAKSDGGSSTSGASSGAPASTKSD